MIAFQFELFVGEIPRPQDVDVLGTQLFEFLKQLCKRLPVRIFKLCEAVERNECRIRDFSLPVSGLTQSSDRLPSSARNAGGVAESASIERKISKFIKNYFGLNIKQRPLNN